MPAVFLLEAAAKTKLRAPDGWKAHSYEGVGNTEDVMVTGSVPDGVHTSGPRKGRPKWVRRRDEKCVVTPAEADAAFRAYEADGCCGECFGTGQAWCGWDRVTGTKYCDCRRCQATGRAPEYMGSAPITVPEIVPSPRETGGQVSLFDAEVHS